jgi:NAD(P)-dependent dehydrogenase (short-subunit alcohol dehydrogenase family)
MADMNGQVALVTGGIRGIGLAIGERLMNRGVRVAAGYSSNRDAAQQFADKYADHGVTVHQGNIGSNAAGTFTVDGWWVGSSDTMTGTTPSSTNVAISPIASARLRSPCAAVSRLGNRAKRNPAIRKVL